MPNAYTYHIKHISSGLNYYGVRTANRVNPKEDLWNRYFTSSNEIKRLIKRDGLSAFIATVRMEFENKDSALLYETRFLKRINAANNLNWLNQHNNLTFSEAVNKANIERTRRRNLNPEFRQASSERRTRLNLEPEFNAFAKENARQMVAKLKAEGKTSERTRKGWSFERRLKHIERNKKMNADPTFKQKARERMRDNNPMKAKSSSYD